MRYFTLFQSFVLLFVISAGLSYSSPDNNVQNSEQDVNHRWMGHDFAFCFVSDDGRLSNLAWADTARVMDFRFTIALNHGLDASFVLSGEEAHDLASDGFEIASHSLTHGIAGLPESCPRPPRSSMLGYFHCDDLDPEEAMQYFKAEIERDSLAVFADIPVSDVKVFAYPRHMHNKAVIDSLIEEGYHGARMGSRWDYSPNSYGDYETYPANSWEEGISLFRIPLAVSSTWLFGDHSADPPVHKSYEEFSAAAQPWVDYIRESGGMYILFDHHLGNDNDSFGDSNYASGGITKQDLAWMVDLVRANDGIVLTLGEAVEYYRSKTIMTMTEDGDYVWQPPVSGLHGDSIRSSSLKGNFPNPFNPRTRILFSLLTSQPVQVTVYDLGGRLVQTLAARVYEAGDHSLDWDGKSTDGRMMPAGVYFVKVKTSNWEDFGKMTLLK